jgi:lysophospholipase L1-like esterase
MRRAAKIVMVNMSVFLMLLLFIEGAVRFFYPHINSQNLDPDLFDPYKFGETYGYKANTRGNEFGAEYVTDERGFRIDPASLDHHKQDKVLVVLGDSVSVGMGVSADHAYPYILNRRLNGHEVINASASGYSLSDYIVVLRTVLPASKAHGIIRGVCLNDVTAISQAHIVEMVQNSNPPGESSIDEIRYPNPIVRGLRYISDNYLNFSGFLKKYSKTYLFLKSVALDSSQNHFQADLITYQEPTMPDLLITEFKRLNDLATHHNAWLIVFLFPYEYQLRVRTEEVRYPQHVIVEAAQRSGVTTYDLYDDILKHLTSNGIPSKSIYLFNDPMHFNERGHQVIADLIYEKITRDGMPIWEKGGPRQSNE